MKNGKSKDEEAVYRGRADHAPWSRKLEAYGTGNKIQSCFTLRIYIWNFYQL